MPFTASLGDDRKGNGLAACAGLLASGLWGSMPWEARRQQCRMCMLRFMKQPSCSLDFLTIGDTGRLKLEIAECLAWVAECTPSWTSFNGCVHEVELVYARLGHDAVPPPSQVLEDFMKVCAGAASDEVLWKDWNIYVEQFEGRPQRAEVPVAMKPAVDGIVDMLTSAARLNGRALFFLYAASSVFEDAATHLGLPTLKQTFGHLLEASRKAVAANASLEVS